MEDKTLEAIICPSYNKSSSFSSFELSQKYEKVFSALAIHPSETNDFDSEYEMFLNKNLQNKKVVALGEYGLDYHFEPFNKQKQIDVFLKELNIAKQNKIFSIFHVRDAFDDFIPILKENLKDVNNSQIIFADALKTPLTEIEKYFEKDYTIIANLPYYITTPIIFKFVGKTSRVKAMNIMVQKEVGERLVATNKQGDYGSISAILSFYADVNILRQVPRRMFTPSPNVDSCVVQIMFIQNKYNCNPSLYESVVKSAFSNKRKTIANNISKDFKINKEEFTSILKLLNLDENVRGDALSTDDFVAISQKLDNLFQN